MRRGGVEAVSSALRKKLGVKPVLAVVAANDTGEEYLKPFDPFVCSSHGCEWVSEEEAFSRLEEQFTPAERWQLDHSLRYVTTSHRNEGSQWHFRRLYTLFDRNRDSLWQPSVEGAKDGL